MEVNETALSQEVSTYSDPVGSQELGKDQFLQLLVAQLQNQDPMEPMSNTEFVAQLAQFSNVEQLVAVNEGINLLGVQQLSMSNAQAASLIGKEVQIRSDQLQVGESDMEANAAFSLSEDASALTVNIRDESGEVVRTLEMGATPKGETQISWDLQDDNGIVVAPGTYRIDVVAENEAGESVQWEAKVRGTVDGIQYDSGYPELIIGDVTSTMSDILGVYPPIEEGP